MDREMDEDKKIVHANQEVVCLPSDHQVSFTAISLTQEKERIITGKVQRDVSSLVS
jgi:hypothetical protein